MLARASGARRVHGYAGGSAARLHHTSIPYTEHEYFGENHARLVGRSLGEFADAVPREAGGYVLFIPGGHRAERRYPLDRYVQVADALGRRRPVKFLFGPETKADEILIRHAGHETMSSPELPDMMDLVRRARLVVANDCGPVHAAHIHDVPRISLFGIPGEIPHRFHAGRKGRVMEPPNGKGIGEIEPRDVIAAAEGLLASAG
jgi:ADP-heptose:LPS heptosyltransferase